MSREYKSFNAWRLIFHCMIFHDGVLVNLLDVDPAVVREFQCEVHSFFPGVAVLVAFGMEEPGFLCNLLALKPFLFIPYVFTTVLREFMHAPGLRWGTYQEKLRVLCIITMGSSDDMTNIPITEVSPFVQPMWLTRISSFSPLFLRPLRYCVLRPFLYNMSLLVVLVRQEKEFCGIHIGSVFVKPRLIYVVNWCCVTALEAHELPHYTCSAVSIGDTITYVPAKDHDDFVIHKGPHSEILLFLHNLEMAQLGNSTEELALPHPQIYTLWCYAGGKFGGKNHCLIVTYNVV
ncbi:hypothetical protein Bca52824_018673 [Brassica carinata]|uniref:Uncharacterized protein n=1 Tax=Brassica carinata TaxID=52824 RepID=A0A8X7VQH6_BRACI|nr:hypothetical protein Bca52824_018673 [Brassica carinata]